MKRGLALCLAVFPVLASAQLNVTSRESRLNYDYVMGNGGNAFSGSDSFLSTTVEPAVEHALEKDHSEVGTDVFGNPWNARVKLYEGVAVVIDGPLNAATRIASGFDSDLDTTESNALVMANIINPGNQTLVTFDVASEVDAKLRGNISILGTDGSAELALQKWDGLVWQPVYTTTPLTSSLSNSILWEGTLTAGAYRMLSQASISNFGTERTSVSGFYSLDTAVPEPCTIAALAIGGLLLSRRGKRKNLDLA